MSAREIAANAERKLYYGWVVVGKLATTETISCAAFLVPMQQELGWSMAALRCPRSVPGLPVNLLLDTRPCLRRWPSWG